MRVWSNRLDARDFHQSAEAVNREFPGTDVFVVVEEDPTTLVRGRWKGARRFDKVSLRATRGIYRPNPGTSHPRDTEGYAASWTEWGWWLVRLFERDAYAKLGDYDGVEDFHEKTGERFRDPRSPRERQIKRTIGRTA